MKLRKLKKKNFRNIGKLDNLSETVIVSAQNVLRGRSCRCTASGSRTKKCGHKTSIGC